jgi:hypothetical protein
MEVEADRKRTTAEKRAAEDCSGHDRWESAGIYCGDIHSKLN